MPTAFGFICFETALGTCGIAWGEAGIVGSQLPEDDAAATRRRMQARFPGATEVGPPEEVQRALELVQAMLRGEPADVSGVRLDMTGVPAFHQRVYEVSLKLKPGETTTYGEMARQLGEPGAARAVGQALGHNPFAPIVPCHRILAAGGRSGGFSANGGAATKLRMLAIEGAMPQGSLFD